MSMEKAIYHGKEHRKPYRRSARFDASCRPHGGCGYCLSNRLHSTEVRLLSANEQIKASLMEESADSSVGETRGGNSMAEKYDEVGAIMEFEAGELDDEGVVTLFQHLVDTGLAWKLQGSYGRLAQAMIDKGIIHPHRVKV